MHESFQLWLPQEVTGVGRSGETQETQPEAVAGSRWEVITGQWWCGEDGDMDTQGGISGLADGMSKGVGKRESQGSFWFDELEYLPELRLGIQLRTGVLGPKTSKVTSESSSVKWDNVVVRIK